MTRPNHRKSYRRLLRDLSKKLQQTAVTEVQNIDGDSALTPIFIINFYSTILNYTILQHTFLQYTILQYTFLQYTILHYTILHYTILHSPIPKQKKGLHFTAEPLLKKD